MPSLVASKIRIGKMKKKASEKTLSCYHFDLARSVSKLSSKLSADDLYSICRPELTAGNSLRTTDMILMKGNVSMSPAVISTSINNADTLAVRSIHRNLRLEPYKASEKAQLVDCVGDWSGAEEHWCSESNDVDHLDSINLDDFELKLHPSSHVYLKSNGRSKPIHPDTISPPIVGWNPRCNSWSTVESNDTVESSSSCAQSRRFDSLDDLTTASCVANGKDNTVLPELPVSLRMDCVPSDDAVETEQELLEDDERSSFISTSVSTSQQSIWLSDYSESIDILGEDHPLQFIKPGVVLTALLAYRSWQYRTIGASNNVTDKDTSGNAEGAGRGQIDACSGKKRSRDQAGGSDEEQENNKDKKAPEKKSRTSKNGSGPQVSLACPFVKKDPVTYRNCYTYGLKRIQDVKQHLSRRHQLPIYCPRCMDIFETENERDEHNRQSNCLLQDPIPFEGVTRAQKQLLTQRVSGKMSLEAQWFTIFEILFPDHHPRPESAYINAELSVDLEAFQDFMHIQGPGIILEALRPHGNLPPATGNEDYDLHTFQQSVIGDGLQIITQRWLATMVLERSEPSVNSNLAPSLNGHSQPSATSSSTLHEQYCEGEVKDPVQAKQIQFGELEQEGVQSFQDMVIETPQIDHTEQHRALPSGGSSPESLYDPSFDDVESWKSYCPQNWFDSVNTTSGC